jgi:uncharacterized protein YjbI with pentapeptide repeats
MMDDLEPLALLLLWTRANHADKWNAWRLQHPGSVDLREAKLRGADLQQTDLHDVSLEGADLREADLRYADLRRADLSRADLRGATLKHAQLEGAIFTGADTRQVLWSLWAYIWRRLPRDWVMLALLVVGLFPLGDFLFVLWQVLHTTPPSLDLLLYLLELLLLPLGFLAGVYVVRLLLIPPFDVILIVVYVLRRILKLKHWYDPITALLAAGMLVVAMSIDLLNPVPFLEVFNDIAEVFLTHSEAVFLMKANLTITYSTLVIVNLTLVAASLHLVTL